MIRFGILLYLIVVVVGCNLFDNSIKGELNGPLPGTEPSPMPPPASGNASIGKQYITPVGLNLSFSVNNYHSLHGSSESLVLTSIGGTESLYLLDEVSGSIVDLMANLGEVKLVKITDVSNDGKTILLCGQFPGQSNNHLNKFDRNTGLNTQLTDDVLMMYDCSNKMTAHFSDSEDYIIFRAFKSRSSITDIFSVPKGGGTTLTLSSNVYSPTQNDPKYDPTGEYLIVSDAQSGTYRFKGLRLDRSMPDLDLTNLSLSVSTSPLDLSFIPNSSVGRYIYYLDEETIYRPELYAVDFDGSNKVKLNNGAIASPIYNYAVATTAPYRVAYTDSADIFLIDNNGMNRTTLAASLGTLFFSKLFYMNAYNKVLYTIADYSGPYDDIKLFSVGDDGLSTPVEISHVTGATDAVKDVYPSTLRDQIVYTVYEEVGKNLSVWETDAGGTYHKQLAPSLLSEAIPADLGYQVPSVIFMDATNLLIYVKNRELFLLDLTSDVSVQISPEYYTGTGVVGLEVDESNSLIDFSGQFNFYETTSVYSYNLASKATVHQLADDLQISSPYFSTVNMGTGVIYEDKGESEIYKALYLYYPDDGQTLKITPNKTLSIETKNYNEDKTWIIYIINSSIGNESGAYSYNIKDRLGPFRVTPPGFVYTSAPTIYFMEDAATIYFSMTDSIGPSSVYQSYMSGYKGENFGKKSNFPNTLNFGVLNGSKSNFIYPLTGDFVSVNLAIRIYAYSFATGLNDFDSRDLFNTFSFIPLENSNRIIYTGSPGAVTNQREMMIADLDGSNRSTIFSSTNNIKVRYLKDELPGSKILYVSDELSGSKDEYLSVDLDGSNKTAISGVLMVNEEINDTSEVVHSESQKTLFKTTVDDGMPTEYELLYSTDFSGNRVLLSPAGVTSGKIYNFYFVDQNTVLYEANYENSAHLELYKINVDGSSRIKLNPALNPGDTVYRNSSLIANDYVDVLVYLASQKRKVLYSVNIRSGVIQQLYQDSRGTDLIYQVSAPSKDGKYIFFMASDWEDPEAISLFYRTPQLSP